MVRAARDQHFSIRQQDSRVGDPRNGHGADETPEPGNRIVDLCAGYVLKERVASTTRNKDLAIGQERCRAAKSPCSHAAGLYKTRPSCVCCAEEDQRQKKATQPDPILKATFHSSSLSISEGD